MNIFLILALISGVLTVVFTFMIVKYLSRHGIKVNWWMVRAYMIRYLKQYKKHTYENSGKTGILFYAWIITISLFAVSGIIGFLVR